MLTEIIKYLLSITAQFRSGTEGHKPTATAAGAITSFIAGVAMLIDFVFSSVVG